MKIFGENFKILHYNSRHYKVPYISEDSLLSVYLRKRNRWVRWQSTNENTKVFTIRNCERRRCLDFPFLQMETDREDWNSLEAE